LWFPGFKIETGGTLDGTNLSQACPECCQAHPLLERLGAMGDLCAAASMLVQFICVTAKTNCIVRY